MKRVATMFALLSCLAGCGGEAPGPRAPDAVAGATDLEPVKEEGTAKPSTESAAPAPHVCEAPLAAPTEVWPRIEAIRALPDDERAARCGLSTVVLFSSWRSLPIDLLAPIVSRAAQDSAALDAWATGAVASAPKAVADVVAMDIAGRFAVGGDPKAGDSVRAQWADSAVAGSPEVAAVLEEAKRLPTLYAEVNAIHEMRCLLEVNALGFAVKCTPIHPQQTPISLSWTTAVRDGVLERFELSSCTGKSCPKLRATAAKLVKRMSASVAEAGKLSSSPVYREQLLSLLVLAPFKSRTASE